MCPWPRPEEERHPISAADQCCETAVVHVRDLCFMQSSAFAVWNTLKIIINNKIIAAAVRVPRATCLSMSAGRAGRKRHAGAGAGAAGGGEKKQRVSENGGGRPAGWLQQDVAERRDHNTSCSFNAKRVRFLSDAQKIIRGRGAVIYWMSRDQRVQGQKNASVNCGTLVLGTTRKLLFM